MAKELEISLQKLDDWIVDVSECKLLAKPVVEALCEEERVLCSGNP